MGVNLPSDFARSTSIRTLVCALQNKVRSRGPNKKRYRRLKVSPQSRAWGSLRPGTDGSTTGTVMSTYRRAGPAYKHIPGSLVLTGHFYWYYHPGRFILLQRPAV